jgi:hypothetical protein
MTTPDIIASVIVVIMFILVVLIMIPTVGHGREPKYKQSHRKYKQRTRHYIKRKP